MTFFRLALSAVMFVVFVAIAYRVALWLRGFKVTSWWRTPWHNEEVGGVKNSLHLIGWAWDIVPGGKVGIDDFKKRFPLPTGTVIDEGNHIHVEVL